MDATNLQLTFSGDRPGPGGGGDTLLRGGTQDDLQVQIHLTWEKAQNRLLIAIDIGGKDGASRRLRRSQSLSSGGSSHAQKQQQEKALLRQQQQQQQTMAAAKSAGQNVKKKKKKQQQKPPSTSELGSKRRDDVKKSATASASADALSSSPTSSLVSSLKLPRPATTAKSSGFGDDRHREAACLRAVDRLLQACRQSLGHPTLTSSYSETVARLARELLRRLEPYRTEAEVPFAMSGGDLDEVRAVAQAVADPNIYIKYISLHLGHLAEALCRLQALLQFHLRPEAALPAMSPEHRLCFLCEYCYLLLKDCNRLAAAPGSACAAGSHASVLLSVMRYFVGNQHVLWTACDAGLLIRCYERLERLASAGPGGGFEQRLRLQSGALGSDLEALCELLIRAAEQRVQMDEQQQQQQQQEQQQPPQHSQSPPGDSCDRRSKSTAQSTVIRVIRHLGRCLKK